MQKFREEILSMVMAGGRGQRLYPLTLERTKPSVPFGGKYRIIDFALSNLINSKIYSIYVLVQYKSQSLIEHIRTTWSKEGLLSKHFITVVPPQMRKEEEWYRGTADSIYQNINLIYDFKPRFVAIFSGDQVYRMNIKEMVDYHLRKKAKLTVAVIPIDAQYANQFGIIDFDENSRIKRFREKPAQKIKGQVYASMGNYIFNSDFLIEIMENNALKNTTNHDFGKDIIPSLIKKGTGVYAYDFSLNKIPSLKKYESRFYWQDVGTISSYWNSNMDILGTQPKLNLHNEEWPIYASHLNLSPAYIDSSDVKNSLICEGSEIYGATIKNSIVGRGVKIEPGCVIEDSIIMDSTQIKKSSLLKKAIIDRFNIIEANSHIYDGVKIDPSQFYVDESKIIIRKRAARNSP